MDRHFLMTTGLTHNMFKCARCDYCVTPPIFQCKFDHLLCCVCSEGRSNCYVCNEPTFPASKIIEKVARCLQYPCMYQSAGCDSKLQFEHINNHETQCEYEPHTCPVTSCNVVISYTDVKKHFLATHQELCQETDTGDIKISFGILECHTVKFIQAFNHKFLLHLNRNKESDYSAVILQYVGAKKEADKFSYEIKLNDSGNELSIQGRVVCYQDQSSNSRNTVIIMDRYVCNEDEAISCLSIKQKIEHKPNETILQIIECPVCYGYMTPPVMLCKLGHSVCHECRKRLNICPVCKQTFGESRNYALENMITTYTILCTNNKDGCLERGSVSHIKKHELNCPYRDFKCIVCDWHGKFDAILQHTQKKHYELISTADFLIWPFFPNHFGSQRWIIESFGKPFVLFYDFQENIAHFAIQAFADCEKYIYTFQIGKNKQKIIVTEICTSYKLSMSDLVTQGKAISISKDRLRTFVADNKSGILIKICIDTTIA